MGREAETLCQLDGAPHAVKAVLESAELILRGDSLRRRWPLAALRAVQATGDQLRFQADGETVHLALGAAQAAAWARKILTPPPSLATKLGLRPEAPAWVLGPVDDAALAEALHGAVTEDPAAATLCIAIVCAPDELAAVLARHAPHVHLPLWLVHLKGRGPHLGDSEIRRTMRAQGYMDNKTSAVSARLTATRYGRRGTA